jgi:endonuclease/exonuclease/phosphatase family metal-dependent hydrolase
MLENKLRVSLRVFLCVVCVGFACSPGAFAEESAPQKDLLRVMTYNVQFLPGIASVRNERPQAKYRAGRIAEEISQFDVVGLQETFHETHRKQIIDRLTELWENPLQSVSSPRAEGFFTCGGCLLLTKRPLTNDNAMVFSNFSKPADYGLRADGFAAKGVIHTRIARCVETADEFVDVFVTHLEARADYLRPLQFQELGEFLKLHSDPASPVLILGDLNTRGEDPFPEDPTSQYSALMNCLREARPGNEVIDVWPALRGNARGGTTEQESHETGKRIDYIIVCNPPSPAIQLRPVSVDVELFQDSRVVALSDHNAVVAELEWTRRLGMDTTSSSGE